MLKTTYIFYITKQLTLIEEDQNDEMIRKILLEKGFEIYSLNRVRPSLEDVFVNLIEKEDALLESVKNE